VLLTTFYSSVGEASLASPMSCHSSAQNSMISKK